MSMLDGGGGLAWALMLAAFAVAGLLLAAVALYWAIMPY